MSRSIGAIVTKTRSAIFFPCYATNRQAHIVAEAVIKTAGQCLGGHIHRHIGQTGRRAAHRHIAVGGFMQAGNCQGTVAVSHTGRSGGAQSAAFGDRHIQNAAIGITLSEGDHAGQCTCTIGARACAAYHIDAFKAFRKGLGPDHPAPEGIVQRHTIQRHQSATCARRGNRPERQALSGGIGRLAVGAPEKRDGRNGPERIIHAGRTGQGCFIQP